MFNPLQSTTIGALEKTIAFTERRHQVLAGNLANMSTPDYRSRDLDVDAFQSALADSIKADSSRPRQTQSDDISNVTGNRSPLAMWQEKVAAHMPLELGSLGMDRYSDPNVSATTSVDAHNSAKTRDDIAGGPRTPEEGIVYHDGSDISLEDQVTRIAKNKHLHSLAITTMRSQFDLMRAAITERA